MKAQESSFFIDKIIDKYQALSNKDKSSINLCVALVSVVFIIGQVYKGGEVFGEFLYNISH